jgi:hypothetical protein
VNELKFDKREPCTSCPYRTDAPLQLWSREEFVNLLDKDVSQMGSTFGCHEYNKRRDEAQVCIGWLLDQRERGVPSINFRLALIRNPAARACLKEASSPAPLYDSIEEMCEANGFSMTTSPKTGRPPSRRS